MAKKRITYDLYGKLNIATIEREVEDAYNNGISLFFVDSPIQHPYNCDGYIEEGLLLRLLIEYKFDESLSNTVARARILVQVLFYLKRFEDNGLPLPNVIMVGDKNECFVIHSNDIIQYLDEAVDWTVAPSSAGDAFPSLVAKISSDTNINPFIFKIERSFDLKQIVDRIRDLSVNVKRYVRVTEHNIAEIFDYFVSSVLRNPESIEPHTIVEVFLGVLLNPMEYYQHPQNRNFLVAGGTKYLIFGDAFISFFDYYNRNYTPQETLKFTEIADRLIEDAARRFSGEFFTPVPFVDYAHRMAERRFGEDWKEQFVVWDGSCGTKNLTRDYRFQNLYCSTLRQGDLQISERYNPEANSFVFDFLDGDDNDLPKSLQCALRDNKPFIFWQNPPYATAGNSNSADKKAKEGVAKTEINQLMIKDGIGKASQNLYAQFIYKMILYKRRYGLTDCRIGLFSPTLFLSGPSWQYFRKEFFSEFKFIEGIQFKASYFADVSDSWGISFTLWESGKTNQTVFPLTLIDKENGRIVSKGEKIVYNLDNAIPANKWVLPNDETPRPKLEMITAKSSLIISNKTHLVGKCLGFFINDCNNVDANTKGVYLMTMPVSRHIATVEITEENIFRCCSLYAARNLVKKNWVNSKDEYCVPEQDHPLWEEFCSDSLVYSLFSSSSNQSSLRNVSFHNQIWNVPNEFFFMPQEQMKSLANEHSNQACFQDVRTDSERFITKLLPSITLSPEANQVLNKARSLVRSSFQYRQLFDLEFPNYQINNWDCGWYQIRALLNKYDPKGLNDFQVLFNSLSEKMKPYVYKLGFLK